MKQATPLSQSQYGIYVECASHIGEIFYNLPYIYTLDKRVDADKLCQAIETAVKNHPTLFTRIETNADGDPMQSIGDDIDLWTIKVEDIDDIEKERANLVQPFELLGGPLFRMRLLRSPEHLYLFIDYHHIVASPPRKKRSRKPRYRRTSKPSASRPSSRSRSNGMPATSIVVTCSHH